MNNPGFILRITKFLATARNKKKQAEKNMPKPADLEPEVVANNSQPSAASDEVQESRDSPENGDAPDPTAVNDDDADTIDLSSASASNPSRPQPELEPNWYYLCS